MEPFWSFAGDGSLVSAPLVVGHEVYVMSSKGWLYALHPNGRLAVSFPLGAPVPEPDESNVYTLTGMNAGDGLLAVAATGRLVVFR